MKQGHTILMMVGAILDTVVDITTEKELYLRKKKAAPNTIKKYHTFNKSMTKMQIKIPKLLGKDV